MVDCPISNIDDYRDQIFEQFTNLEILDDCDKEGNELAYDDEEYDDEEDGEVDEAEDDEESEEYSD